MRDNHVRLNRASVDIERSIGSQERVVIASRLPDMNVALATSKRMRHRCFSFLLLLETGVPGMNRVFTFLTVALVALSHAGTAAGQSSCSVPDYVEFTSNPPWPSGEFGAGVDMDGRIAVIGAPRDLSAGNADGAAFVFEYTDGTWQQLAKLTPADPLLFREFGSSVAIDGDTIVVGGRLVVPGAVNRFVVAVFRNIEGQWQQVATLTNSLGSGDEYRDVSIAIFGSTIAVGSPNSAFDGAVFLFQEYNGIWLSTIVPTPDPDDGHIQFGRSIVLTHDQMNVGAPYALNEDGTRTGAFYVYRFNGATPYKIGKIAPSVALESAQFGASLTLTDNTLAVGAPSDGDLQSPRGAVHLYQRSGASWSALDVLSPPDAPFVAGFGKSVAIQGNTLAIGSERFQIPGQGACVIYRNNGTWNHVATLSPLPFSYSSGLGTNVSLGDNVLLAGARRGYINTSTSGTSFSLDLGFLQNDCNANGVLDICDVLSGDSPDCNGNGIPDECDIASNFSTDCNGNNQLDECEADGQNEIARIDSPAPTDEEFGWSVSLSNDTAIVGAPYNNEIAFYAGAAYIFRKDADGWQQIATLRASDGVEQDKFGESVSISGDTAIVGAQDDDDAVDSSGSAYVFREINGNWQQIAKLTADDAAENDRFGVSVAIDGQTAVIGTSANTDAAYVFREVNGVWQQITKLTSPTPEPSHPFGNRVAIDGDTIVVTEPLYGQDPAGEAHVFQESAGLWQHVATLTASDARRYDYFGRSVAISNDTIVVGIQGSFSGAAPIDRGRAIVYQKDGESWNETAILFPEPSAEDSFGSSVDVQNGVIVVGDAYDGVTGAYSRHGPVYIFRDIDGVWQRVLKLRPSDDSEDTRFGGSVATDGSIVLTGTARIPLDQGRTGAAYVHKIELSNSGDLDDDGDIDSDDLLLFADVLLEFDADHVHVSRADMNCSGNVDGLDIQRFVSQWIAP